MKRHSRLAITVGLCLVLPSLVAAQSLPVDLIELSLEELLQTEVPGSRESDVGSDPIRVGYRYLRAEFEGFRDGTDPVSIADLLGSLGPETYPILQTAITQQAHLIDLGYEINGSWSLEVVVPFIEQSSDHVSVIPGYEFFVIESQGLGDLLINGAYRHEFSKTSVLHLTAGVSLPTGSIDETGDTPSPGPINPLPYTMQLGSGTWDVPLGLTYSGRTRDLSIVGRLDYGGRVSGMIRTGEGDARYRLGHRMAVTGWFTVRPVSWLEPQVRLTAETWSQIEGRDERLPGPPTPAFFPTPVVNPDLYGGEKVLALVGLNMRWPRGNRDGSVGSFLTRQTLQFEAGVPVYQNLNGPQQEEDWRIQFSWGIALPTF